MHVECDYCDADATWYHWADSRSERSVNRECYACDEHAKWLNKYSVEVMDA